MTRSLLSGRPLAISVPFVNPELLTDDVLDSTRPAALIHEFNGAARLVRSRHYPQDTFTRRRIAVPLFIDVHNHIEGLTEDAVNHAHEADLKTQEKHGVKYLRYWFNEQTGKVFCLIDAPSKEAAIAVHREAHGLVADDLIEVKEGA